MARTLIEPHKGDKRRRSICIDPVHLENNPTVVTSPMDGSLFAGCFEQPAIWHPDAARGLSTPSLVHDEICKLVSAARYFLVLVHPCPESLLQPPSHLPIGIVRDTDAAGLRDTFKPRSDIHTVAEYVIIFDDDVANVNADPNFDPFVLWLGRIALDHAVLNLNSAADSVVGTRKLN